ncbi:hypothetical protein [Natronomonas gomsonensis]|uniref:hypothetical protein n=1 Tax=Natronomonas gomsonensis TaxID=1046043 RepID=UPI0015C0B370|nr:hypothetical protein [Natronomonas gomsonensis]
MSKTPLLQPVYSDLPANIAKNGFVDIFSVVPAVVANPVFSAINQLFEDVDAFGHLAAFGTVNWVAFGNQLQCFFEVVMFFFFIVVVGVRIEDLDTVNGNDEPTA